MDLTKEELAISEAFLKEEGYKKNGSRFKNEDYSWWKSFHVTKDQDGDKVIGYQIALLVYDFSKHEAYSGVKPIGIQFEFLHGPDNPIGRIDLSISSNTMTFDRFEEIAERFYTSFCMGYLNC